MPESFDDYKRIQQEVEDNLMTRLYPTLNSIHNSLNELNKKLDTQIKATTPMLDAFNSSANGRKYILQGMKIVMYIGGFLGALYAIGEFVKGLYKAKIL